jgi:hypothetical protein
MKTRPPMTKMPNISSDSNGPLTYQSSYKRLRKYHSGRGA